MDLIFKHTQEKREHKLKESKSSCELLFFTGNTSIEFRSYFQSDYFRFGNKKNVRFVHSFNMDTNTGDFITTYQIINEGVTEDRMFRNCHHVKKNNFKLFFDLTENGYLRGEKRSGFWGVKYQRQIDVIFDLMYQVVSPKFKTEYLKQKTYINKSVINNFYDLVVDFHLDVKNIKPHDAVYYDIQYDYPKKKWLEKNEYKFLPSVLDSYGIKSKYLVSELSKNVNRPLHINSLNFLCKLFGDNYMDYIKQIDWSYHCFEIPNRKLFELKNESEKNCLLSVIKNWEKQTMRNDSLIYNLNKILSIREFLESKGLELKFKARNDNDFDSLLETWSGMKNHLNRGFRLKYNLPDHFSKMIEEPFEIDGQTYKPKLLVTEEDFRIEGFTMKNCMSKQFPHGAIYLYVALQSNKKRINLQYKGGRLIQSYGKANTSTPEIFKSAVDIMNQRFGLQPNITWTKQKYDFIQH